MTKETGGTAFPRPAVFTTVGGLASVEQDGMTLRDYFAAKAMQGMMANSWNQNYASWAELAYMMADAMLEARK